MSAELIVRLTASVAVRGGVAESVACTVKLAPSAATNGVPESTPVDALRDKPPGSVPALTDQETGPTAPDVENVELNSAPTTAFGNVIGRIDNSVLVLILSASVVVSAG